MDSFIPTIKVYNIDYDFIISNYLDVRLWSKVWTLFVYKYLNITICLNSIDTKNNVISFEVCLTKNNYKSTHIIRHNLRNSTISILKNQINGAMESLMTNLEYSEIKTTPEYVEMQKIVSEERSTLYDTASKFLDQNGVHNTEIREVYIDNFIYSNSQAEGLLSSYLYSKRYTYLTDLYLLFADITKNDVLTSNVKKANDSLRIQNLLKDIKEFELYMQTEDYKIDLDNNLENI